MKETMVFLAWFLFLIMLSLGINRYIEKQQQPNQQLNVDLSAELTKTVKLRQNKQGHYIVEGKLNGYRALFIVDTGASSISIPISLANKMNLSKGYPVRSRTANGEITVYQVNLESVQLGPIIMNGVRAHINPHMEGEAVLLGMSFLKHLVMLQKNGVLTLSVH